MGSSKNSPKVYDYLLSVDYGVCAGPVDSFNQVWVKDKPIWCGTAKSRQDIEVDLPELFGGDESEGGVEGVVEVYVGDDEQVNSDQLARRFGMTSALMPAYRGLAHLFFRSMKTIGPNDTETEESGGVVEPPADVWGKIVTVIRDVFDETKQGASDLGFKWTTNNPYFPEVKVAVTRCPRTLDDELAEIWPYGNPIDYPENYEVGQTVGGADPKVITTQMGFNQGGFLTTIPMPPEVVNGMATFTARYRVRCVHNGALGTVYLDPALCAYSFTIAQYDANGSILSNPTFPGSKYGHSENSDEIVDITFNGKIHPEATEVRIVATFAPWDPITSVMQISSSAGARDFILTYYEPYLHCLVDGTLGPLPDANPAHWLYEILTNQEWGACVDPEDVDVASFMGCAQKLYDEWFGVSMVWTRQTEISTLISEVLDHIRGFLFLNPSTGLWQMRLLREESDAHLSPVLDPSNCVITDQKRRTWDGTFNEIIVSYTDPATEEEATVSSHDLGNIQVQGVVVSETRNYYGIRNEDLAQKVADRDVAEAAYPLWSGSATVSRSHELLLPGDLRVLNWPEDGISGMVVRVLDVNYGKVGDRSYKVKLVEDIFSAAKVRYRKPQRTSWDSEIRRTGSLSDVLVTSVPAPFLYRTGVEPAEVDDRYPDTAIMILGAADNYELLDMELRAPVIAASGVSEVRIIATISASGSVSLDSGTDGEVVFEAEAVSTVPASVVELALSDGPKSGDMLLLGSEDERQEVVMLLSEAGGEWTVARGIFDTVPRQWVSPMRMWEFSADTSLVDPVTRVVGETLEYHLYPRGAAGVASDVLAESVTTDIVASEWVALTPGDPVPEERPGTVVSRAVLPFRPANVSVDIGDGPTGFGHLVSNGFPASVNTSWANRNRNTEDAIAPQWGTGNVTPETGQTTVIRILDENRGYVNEIETAVGDTTATLAEIDFGGVEIGIIQFLAKRDGFLSFAAHEMTFSFENYGYGYNYGEKYGP